MMKKITHVMLAGAILLLATPLVARAQSDDSFLSFTSQVGDYIGGGQSRLFTPDVASFQESSTQNNSHVGVIVFPFDGGFWFLDLAAPDGHTLQAGAYENAVR